MFGLGENSLKPYNMGKETTPIISRLPGVPSSFCNYFVFTLAMLFGCDELKKINKSPDNVFCFQLQLNYLFDRCETNEFWSCEENYSSQ